MQNRLDGVDNAASKKFFDGIKLSDFAIKSKLFFNKIKKFFFKPSV